MLDAPRGVLSMMEEAILSESISQLSSLLESQAEDRLVALVSFAQKSLENGAGDEKPFREALSEALLQLIRTLILLAMF